jgi:hypothetical protein
MKNNSQNKVLNSKDQSSGPTNNIGRKMSKVKINTEIDILKYNKKERLSAYTPNREDVKNRKFSKKNLKRKKKEKGILKNKNGRSRTLVLKSNIKEMEEKNLNLNLKKEGAINRTISSNNINNLFLNNIVNKKSNGIPFNNNKLNKEKERKKEKEEKVDQLNERKINKDEIKNPKIKRQKKYKEIKIKNIMVKKEKENINNTKNEIGKRIFLTKLKENNNIKIGENLDYEIVYSSRRTDDNDDSKENSSEERIEKNIKNIKNIKKRNKKNKSQLNKSWDVLIKF